MKSYLSQGLSIEAMQQKLSRFPKGVPMTVDEVAEVVGPEFKEMNENPPPEVVKVREEMENKKEAYTSYRGDPVWIEAKYPGVAQDGTTFKKRDRILWWPRTKTIMVGRQAEDAWRKFESEAQDEEFMSHGHYASEEKEAGAITKVRLSRLPRVVQQAIVSRRITKREVSISTKPWYYIASPGDDGNRGFFTLIDLDNNIIKTNLTGEWGGGALGKPLGPVDKSDDTKHMLPVGQVVVQGQEGGAAYVSIICNPEDLSRLTSGGKLGSQESDTEARFEEGKPADPTENMSPEDKKKWEEMNDKHEDKFKTAGEREQIPWERFRDGWKYVDNEVRVFITDEPRTITVRDRDIPPRENFLDEELLADGIPELMDSYGNTAQEYEKWVAQGWWPKPKTIQDVQLRIDYRPKRISFGADFNSEREAKQRAEIALPLIRQQRRPTWLNMEKYGSGLHAGLPGDEAETDTDARFEEGVSADPTENMSDDAKAKWDEYHGQIDNLGKHAGKEKGPGIPDGTGPMKDDPECPFNKDASTGLYGYTRATQSDCEAAMRKIQRHAGKIAKAAASRDGKIGSFLSTHAKRGSSLPAKILVAAIKDLAPKIASEEKEAGAIKRGLYGFPTKTASLGLNACSELRGYVGEIAEDLHSRRADRHEHITGFLKNHVKQARNDYARMMLSCYPEAVVAAIQEAQEKQASAPSSVEEWLAWEP